MKKKDGFFQKYGLDIMTIRDLDKPLIVSTILLIIFGLVNIYLCTKGYQATASPFDYVKKQFEWFIVSLIVMYAIIKLDFTKVYRYTPIFYWFSVALLTTVWIPKVGLLVNGARGWITLGFTQLQPSEIAKYGILLMVAKLLDDMDWQINNIKNFAKIAVYVLIPVALIVIQPDMGVGMVCFFIVLSVVFVAGLDKRIIGGGLIAIFVGVLILWNSGIIKPYQKARILEFASSDTQDTSQGYQLNQSMIGIGNGGLIGIKPSFSPNVSPGYAGTHVPEIQTDFIFCAIGEQFGFLGTMFVLIMYVIIVSRIIKIGRKSKDRFGSLICVGVSAYFIFAVTQNIGMTIGLMPITGITLPLISYGGSSLLTTTVAIALVLNIGIKKIKIRF